MTHIIKKIIIYYAHNKVRPEIKDRVLKRLATTRDDINATEVYQQLWDEIDTKISAKKRHTFLQKNIWTKIAAAIIPILILFGLAEFYIINTYKQPKNFVLQYRYTKVGENKTLLLPDGTKVNMKGGTVIQYPVSFEGDERIVYLNGEAFFDVHHDSSKSFRVITSYFDITDIGTSFHVSSYMTTNDVYVYVKTGCVELHSERGSKSYKLSQNENLLYNVKSGEIKLGRGLPELAQSWKMAQINIDNMTLGETMKKLSKIYGIKILFNSKKNYNQCITAHFNRGETLESVLKVIGNIFPDFHYKINEDKVVIY